MSFDPDSTLKVPSLSKSFEKAGFIRHAPTCFDTVLLERLSLGVAKDKSIKKEERKRSKNNKIDVRLLSPKD